MSTSEDPKPLTRKELASFLPNQRAIRAFEKLFELVPGEIITVDTSSGSAEAKSQQAISMAISNEQRSKSNGVLLWLSM